MLKEAFRGFRFTPKVAPSTALRPVANSLQQNYLRTSSPPLLPRPDPAAIRPGLPAAQINQTLSPIPPRPVAPPIARDIPWSPAPNIDLGPLRGRAGQISQGLSSLGRSARNNPLTASSLLGAGGLTATGLGFADATNQRNQREKELARGRVFDPNAPRGQGQEQAKAEALLREELVRRAGKHAIPMIGRMAPQELQRLKAQMDERDQNDIVRFLPDVINGGSGDFVAPAARRLFP